jgi:O-antigen ligase
MAVYHAAQPLPRRLEPARALTYAAGVAGLTVFGFALSVGLSQSPPPLVLLVAAGLGLLAMLALAVARFSAAVALGVMLLAVVRIEPAPPDLVFAVVVAVALVTARFSLGRVPLSVTALVSVFLALNLLAMLEVIDAARAIEFFGITFYLGVLGLWLASYVSSVGRARLVVGAYIAAATLSALVAVLALFVAFPGSELLVRGPRAQGLFKDPNVFGPFLVPLALILLEETAFPRLFRLRPAVKLVLLSVLVVGILFSFSRAAWLNLAVGAFVLLSVLALRRGAGRRLLAVLAGIVAAGAVLFTVLAVTSSFGFLQERARFQAYDTERFGAQLSGVDLALQYPLGIGPGQFERVSPLSAHSTYVRALTEEGVLGLAVVLALLLLTLGFALRGALDGREVYGIGSAALLGAWCGLIANSVFVDTLHWRHLWLVAALIWAGATIPRRRYRRTWASGDR